MSGSLDKTPFTPSSSSSSIYSCLSLSVVWQTNGLNLDVMALKRHGGRRDDVYSRFCAIWDLTKNIDCADDTHYTVSIKQSRLRTDEM